MGIVSISNTLFELFFNQGSGSKPLELIKNFDSKSPASDNLAQGYEVQA